MSTIIYCTICKHPEEAITVCKRYIHYVDDIIIIHQYDFDNISNNKYRKLFDELNAKLYHINWIEDFSWYRNQYVKKVGELILEKNYDIDNTWLFITDTDEVSSIPMLENLRHVIDDADSKYSGKGATTIHFNAHDVFVRDNIVTFIPKTVEELIETDKGKNICYNHTSNFFKEMIVKYNTRLAYQGKVHHMLHGTGLKLMNAPKEFYYDHIKTEMDLHAHGCRNYFIGGGGMNMETDKWKELRQITDKYNINNWEKMESLMKKCSINDEIKQFFIKHKDDKDDHTDSELRSFYLYYNFLCTNDIIV